MNKNLLRDLSLLTIAVLVLVLYTYSDLRGSLMSDKTNTLTLATTTSTYDSGLLDYIIPVFEEDYTVSVKIISVGTGQAIKNGEKGDVDIILVHAPDAEKKFVDSGYGLERNCVMYNDFVLLGKSSDPAKIKGLPIISALKTIQDKKSTFLSRGDDSGTNKKELKLWKSALSQEGHQKPSGDWYKETGAGMGDTLRMANDFGAYTLSDRATFLAFKEKYGEKYDLVILVQGDKELLNPYGLIAVNPKLHNVNNRLAEKFITWFLSDKTQNLIGNFTKSGEQLFTPLRGKCLDNQSAS